MKILKIEDNHGHFLGDDNAFSPVDRITKEDLLRLVNLTLTEEVEFDDYDSEDIKNQAHQILYKSIYEKLRGLRDRKQKFTDESERLYLQEYDKYREEPSQHGGAQDLESAGASSPPVT
ncbi:MAG: hypothetical protein KAI76_09945 [Alphaproteobacteria bacterium]|nr:hypothetical protein [Alphaproteobacteria bacterium]